MKATSRVAGWCFGKVRFSFVTAARFQTRSLLQLPLLACGELKASMVGEKKWLRKQRRKGWPFIFWVTIWLD